MYRRMLIATLMLGIGMVGFSKPNKDEIKYVNRKEAAKTFAINKQNESLDDMRNQLKGNGKNAKIPNPNSDQQFLYQDDLVESVLKAKSHSLKDVFKKLCDKSNKPTELIYEGFSVGNIEYRDTLQKKGEILIDSTKLIVPVSFQVHTIAKGNVSDVRYKVTSTWKVELNEKSEKVEDKKVRYFVPKEKTKIVSSTVTPIKFLASEQKSMKTAAQDEIVEWYANLPQTLGRQYAEQSVTSIEAMSVSHDKIKMGLPTNQEFMVKEVPAITVDVDPYQFISENDTSLYTNPTASIVIAPTFNVTVDNTFKKAEIKVSYEVKEIRKPITDQVKVERSKLANSVVTEFVNQLSEYVSSRDAEQKTYIRNMFDATEGNVEVSHLSKYGSEKIKKESAQKYLSLLKGTTLNFTVDNVEVVDLNWNTLIYLVSQEFKSNTYCDSTQKRIYLTFDSEKNTYIINKIEVVPNSTKIE